ncbi:MAG: DUF1013 domain-containing protein [Rhodospirillales bacterium]|jgi:uncharacterized protein|nr:DUF1013 domain-containing protein [Rhodospirillales bacterium]
MTRPLMPKATAVWLLDNTTLTFEQIAAFCELHMLEIQAIADDEVAVGMQGLDPVRGGELELEEIKRCEADPAARLDMTQNAQDHAKQQKKKKARYTPVSKRQDRPDAIAWLLKNYPELTDAQIGKLIGTTKPTINSIRDRSHWNTPNITAQNPVGLGLCTSTELEKVITLARARAGIVSAPAEEAQAEAPAAETVEEPQNIDAASVFANYPKPESETESEAESEKSE